MSMMHIALILWRTPTRAMRRLHTEMLPRGDWRDMLATWWPVPRWARQHPLLVRIMQLPIAERYAVLQLVFPVQLGTQRNPRALVFALRACMPLACPTLTWPRATTPLCTQYDVLLASGQSQTLRSHLRRCVMCQQRARMYTATRQAVIAAVTSMQLPAAVPTTVPVWLIGVLLAACVVALGFVVPLGIGGMRTQQVGTSDARALLQRAEATLYQPDALAEGVKQYQQYDIYWQFADGSVAMLTGELWYSQAPAQYRAQLTHHAGGAPYELDIASQAFRLYTVSASYARDVWPPAPYAARVIMPMADQQPRDAWYWRMRQGAWGVPYRVLHDVQQETIAPTNLGSTIASDGTALVRLHSGTWWIDIDPQSGRLYALWRVHAQGAQLRWRWRWQQQSPIADDRVFVVKSPYTDAQERTTPALHPAMPLIPAGAAAQRQGDTLAYDWWGKRCQSTLAVDFVARCVAVQSGRETVYTVGRIP